MKDKKSLISKCLLGGGLLALICGIFCFFGSAISITISEEAAIQKEIVVISNLFAFMFGTEATATFGGVSEAGKVSITAGTTTLFVIEMIIIVLAVILLIGVFAKKLQKKYITIGSCVVCVLALVAVILAFCSKRMIINADTTLGLSTFEQMGAKFSLGSAGISYGVLGIVGILATGAGLYLGKDQAIGA